METKQTEAEAISWVTPGKLSELATRRYPGVDCVAVVDAEAWLKILADLPRPGDFRTKPPDPGQRLTVTRADQAELFIEVGAEPGMALLGPSGSCRRVTRWLPMTTFREVSSFEFEGPHSHFKVTGV